jgi:hypothetical protein
MPFVAFGDFVPDVSPFGNPGSPNVVNAVPGPNGFRPIGSLTPATSSLTARPRGAIAATDGTGGQHLYAGDVSKLYRLASGTWTDSSKSGGYASDERERWEFVRWQNEVIATNFSDEIQVITMGDTEFDDLTTDFRARHIAVIRDHVFAGNTTDSSDGAVPHRLRWSAFNDPTNWTIDPSTGADYRDLNRGAIQAIVGGEFGVVLTTGSVFRVSWVGAPVWFQLDETLPGIGCIAPGSVAQLGDTVYFLSQSGFVAVQAGTGVQYIGAGRVDKFVREDILESNMHRISSAVDPRAGRIFWAYPGSGNTGGRPNRIICYDRIFDKWSVIEQDVELLWRSSTQGATLEQLDSFGTMDSLPASLDSPRWQGGAVQLSAFDTIFRSGSFDGSAMSASIETKEAELHEGHRAHLDAFRVAVSGGSVTAQVGARNDLSDPVTWSTPLNKLPSGRFTKRSNARFHRVRVNLSGDWSDALGVHIDLADARRGGRRG